MSSGFPLALDIRVPPLLLSLICSGHDALNMPLCCMPHLALFGAGVEEVELRSLGDRNEQLDH